MQDVSPSTDNDAVYHGTFEISDFSVIDFLQPILRSFLLQGIQECIQEKGLCKSISTNLHSPFSCQMPSLCSENAERSDVTLPDKALLILSSLVSARQEVVFLDRKSVV